MAHEPGRALPRIDCLYDPVDGWTARCAWVDDTTGDTGFVLVTDYPTPQAAVEALERRLVQWKIPWDIAPPFRTVHLVVDVLAPSPSIADLRAWARHRGWVTVVEDPDVL